MTDLPQRGRFPSEWIGQLNVARGLRLFWEWMSANAPARAYNRTRCLQLENVRREAVRLLAVGVGTATAGPLGAAIGGLLGGLFSEQASKVLEEYLRSSGEALTELGVHQLYDELRERKGPPPLEAVAQEALRLALKKLQAQTDVPQPKAWAEWFTNWDWRLRSTERFDSLSEMTSNAALTPDSTFRGVMERLDGEARAHRLQSASGVISVSRPH